MDPAGQFALSPRAPAWPDLLPWALALTLAFSTPLCAEPDEARLGAPAYPVGTARTFMSPVKRVGSWSAMEQVPGLQHRRVTRGGIVSPLEKTAQEPAITYRFDNRNFTLDDYLERRRVTGLLVVKDGKILVERYRYGRTSESRFLSFSMAKTVIALLVGIALERGAIASLDEPADKYVPEIGGSQYGTTPIRHLLRMSSGMRFSERYDGNDDIARMNAALYATRTGLAAFVRGQAARDHPPGAKFSYASIETVLLGRVLEGATARDVSSLTREWLWHPLGAEQDAAWRLDNEGKEGVHGFFNATLRDWGRLGVMLAGDGVYQGRQMVPRDFLLDATDAKRQPPQFRPRVATPGLGYGYQVWLWPLHSRTFMLQGVYGQALLVQPESGIVVVQTSAFEAASGRDDPAPTQERSAFFSGVLRSLGGKADSY